MKPFLPIRLSYIKTTVVLTAIGLMSILFVGRSNTPTEITLVESKDNAQVAHDCSQHTALAQTVVSEDQKAAAKKLIQSSIRHKIQNDWNKKSGMSMCWAEDTDPARVADFYRNAKSVFPGTNMAHSLNTSFGGAGTGKFEPSPGWFFNAENPVDQSFPLITIPQGSCFTLTWSFIPDGVSMFGFNGEPTSPSQLIAWLDNTYGCVSTADLTQSCWFSLFTDVFDDWAAKTGVNYRYVSDDSAPLTGFPPFLPDGETWSLMCQIYFILLILLHQGETLTLITQEDFEM